MLAEWVMPWSRRKMRRMWTRGWGGFQWFGGVRRRRTGGAIAPRRVELDFVLCEFAWVDMRLWTGQLWCMYSGMLPKERKRLSKDIYQVNSGWFHFTTFVKFYLPHDMLSLAPEGQFKLFSHTYIHTSQPIHPKLIPPSPPPPPPAPPPPLPPSAPRPNTTG